MKPQRICDGADMYDESLALPSLINLRHQMRQRSQEHALSVSSPTLFQVALHLPPSTLNPKPQNPNTKDTQNPNPNPTPNPAASHWPPNP